MTFELKPMPLEELKKEIGVFLNQRKVLVLCTCSKNVPRATPLDFYMENERDIDDFTIYVGLSPGRKVKNIEDNPVVSIGIYTPMNSGKIQGMQITASKRENLIFLKDGDLEFNRAQNIVKGKRNLILKIVPETIELLDYDFSKRGYSRFQRLVLDK